MKAKHTFLLLQIAFGLLDLSTAASLLVCPDITHMGILEGSDWVEVPPQQQTSLVRMVRLPPEGFYNSTISCISIMDIFDYENANTPEVRAGGIGERFVQVRLTSAVGLGLTYFILVYSNDNPNINSKTCENLLFKK